MQHSEPPGLPGLARHVGLAALTCFTGPAGLSGLAALPALAGLAVLAGFPALQENISTDLHAKDEQDNLSKITCLPAAFPWTRFPFPC